MTSAVASLRQGVGGFTGVLRAQTMLWSQYRANLAIWATTGMLQSIVYLSVWRAVANASGGAVGGYDAAQFAGYFCVMLFVREMTYSFIAWHLSGTVQQGAIAPMLARPQHPVLYFLAEMTSYRLVSITLVVPAAFAVGWYFDAEVHPSVGAVVVALLLLPLASVVRTLGDVLIGLTSVKFIRIGGILTSYYTVVVFMSGQFAPLTVLPDWMQTVAKALPFWWIVGYPVELLMGRADPHQAWIAALVLLTWFVAAMTFLRWVWPRAMRAAETVGG
ncbi:MAG: ABC-2 family transporter protein [Thermoleophilia bacterium]|nr:ABC-2 family transporter protein [Thermoleophilia bacterium]